VLAAWCEACGLDDELFRRLILARRADGLLPTWFEDWPDLEATATTLRWFGPLLVPGLLQTEMYARALYATRVVLSKDDIDSHIAARLGRQEILAGENPPMLWVIIDEGRCADRLAGADHHRGAPILPNRLHGPGAFLLTADPATKSAMAGLSASE
jgi:hypothetical protein